MYKTGEGDRGSLLAPWPTGTNRNATCGEGPTAPPPRLSPGNTENTTWENKTIQSSQLCHRPQGAHLSNNCRTVFVLSSGDARLGLRNVKGLHSNKITTRNLHLPLENGTLTARLPRAPKSGVSSVSPRGLSQNKDLEPCPNFLNLQGWDQRIYNF